MKLLHNFRCGQCGKDGSQKGSKYLLVRGVRTKVCGPCVERRQKAGIKPAVCVIFTSKDL